MAISIEALRTRSCVLQSFASLVMAMVGGVILLFGIPATLVSLLAPDPVLEQARSVILIFTTGGAALFIVGLLGQIAGKKKWKGLMAQAVPSPCRSELTWNGSTGKIGVQKLYELAATGSCAYCGRKAGRTRRATQSLVPEKYDWLCFLGGPLSLPGILATGIARAALEERMRKKFDAPKGVRGVALRYTACPSCWPTLTWAWLGMLLPASALLMATSGALRSPTAWRMVGVFLLMFGGFCIAMAGVAVSQKMHPFRIAFEPGKIVIEGPEHLSIR